MSCYEFKLLVEFGGEEIRKKCVIVVKSAKNRSVISHFTTDIAQHWGSLNV